MKNNYVVVRGMCIFLLQLMLLSNSMLTRNNDIYYTFPVERPEMKIARVCIPFTDYHFIERIQFSQVEEIVLNSYSYEYFYVYLHGLDKYKKNLAVKPVVLRFHFLKPSEDKIALVDGIAALDVFIAGERKIHFKLDNIDLKNKIIEVKGKHMDVHLENADGKMNKAKSEKKVRLIKINGYEKLKKLKKIKKLLGKAVITCRSQGNKVLKQFPATEISNSYLAVPLKTRTIEFKNTLLEGKKLDVSGKTGVHLVVKTILVEPVDKENGKTLDNVLYQLYQQREKNQIILDNGIFTADKQFIELAYPGADHLYLLLTTVEHRKLKIPLSTLKLAPAPNTVKLSRESVPKDIKETISEKTKKTGVKTITITFRIQNGSGARIRVGRQEWQNVGDDETVHFTIDPKMDKDYEVIKKDCTTIKKNLEQGRINYHFKLNCKSPQKPEPPKPKQKGKQKPRKPKIRVTVMNNFGYKGKLYLQDDSYKNNKYEVPLSGKLKIGKVAIRGRKIVSAQLERDIIKINEKETKFQVSRTADGKQCNITPVWQVDTYTVIFTLKDYGQRRPETIDVYIKDVIQENGTKAEEKLTFSIQNSANLYQKEENFKFSYFQNQRTIYIKENRDLPGKSKTVEVTSGNRILDIDEVKLRGPALGIVAVLGNSIKGIENQLMVDEKLRKLSQFESDYESLYLGWVDYVKNDFRLNDFDGTEERQIEITDRKAIDFIEVLGKLIPLIKKKFVGINVLEGQKIKPDELRIILNNASLFLDDNKLAEERRELNIKLIDIKEVLDCTPEELVRKIKEEQYVMEDEGG